MPDHNRRLLTIWEDTVDLRELLIGITLGSVLGFVCYLVSLRLFAAQLPNITADLRKGYALLAGILGCVAAAVIIAVFIKPKRTLQESAEGLADPAEVLADLGLDPAEERGALEHASPKMTREMQQLRIHDAFSDFAGLPRRTD